MSRRFVNADPTVRSLLKVVFLPNSQCEPRRRRSFRLADLSEQISTAGMEASGTGNMKMGLNGALTIGTLDGANVEMKEHVGDDNIFIFGLTAQEVEARRAKGIDSTETIAGSSLLREALDEISAGVFSPDDPGRYRGLVDVLTHHDYFMVCADFEAYWAAQMKVDERWRDKAGWWRASALNTANMGWFSSDRTIQEYRRRNLRRFRSRASVEVGSWSIPGEARRCRSRCGAFAARQDDPFAVLGPHETVDGWAIRAFAPGAETLRAVTRAGAPIVGWSAARGLLRGRRRWTLERRARPIGWTRPTPARNGPSMIPTPSGPRSDRCGRSTCWSKSSHRQLCPTPWRAQLATHEGVDGVVFALWAPNAFAGFRRRRLQSMGRPSAARCANASTAASGKYSCPDLGAGAVYKYEIISAQGALLPLKAGSLRLPRPSAAPRPPRSSPIPTISPGPTPTIWSAASMAIRGASRCRPTKCISARGGAARTIAF